VAAHEVGHGHSKGARDRVQRLGGRPARVRLVLQRPQVALADPGLLGQPAEAEASLLPVAVDVGPMRSGALTLPSRLSGARTWVRSAPWSSTYWNGTALTRTPPAAQPSARSRPRPRSTASPRSGAASGLSFGRSFVVRGTYGQPTLAYARLTRSRGAARRPTACTGPPALATWSSACVRSAATRQAVASRLAVPLGQRRALLDRRGFPSRSAVNHARGNGSAAAPTSHSASSRQARRCARPRGKR
jgi:hypothetical protein